MAVAACIACVPLTWAQTAYWKDSETLFQHAIDVTGENYLAQHNLGNYLLAVVVMFVARFASGFGFVLFCIGIVFTIFWAMCVTFYAFAQTWKLATVR